LKDYKAKDGIAMGVLAIGIPASLNSVLMSSSNIMLNNVMGSYDDLAVAGLGVAMKVNMIVVMLLIGIGGGVQPLFGYFFGAGNKKRYMEIFRFSMILSVIVSIVMSIICYFGADFLVRTFLDNDDAYAYAFSFSRKYIISGPILGILFILMNAIQATGAAIPALILSISRQGLVFIPVLFTLNAVFHTEAVVALSQPITDYIAILMSVAVFFFVYRKYIMRLKPRGQVDDTKQVVHSD
ncbi:MAG: MATE family efflux transporter, partial [Lachnospiraceae bacterium]|nr:MATE family efflux transporter [Lachnospiraceae bacterium]